MTLLILAIAFALGPGSAAGAGPVAAGPAGWFNHVTRPQVTAAFRSLKAYGAFERPSRVADPKKGRLLESLERAGKSEDAAEWQVFAPFIEAQNDMSTGDLDSVLEAAVLRVERAATQTDRELQAAKLDFDALEGIINRAALGAPYSEYLYGQPAVRPFEIWQKAALAQARIIEALTTNSDRLIDGRDRLDLSQMGANQAEAFVLANSPAAIQNLKHRIAKYTEPENQIETIQATIRLALRPQSLVGPKFAEVQKQALPLLFKARAKRGGGPWAEQALDGIIRIGRESPYEPVKRAVISGLEAENPEQVSRHERDKIWHAIADIARESGSEALRRKASQSFRAGAARLDGKDRVEFLRAADSLLRTTEEPPAPAGRLKAGDAMFVLAFGFGLIALGFGLIIFLISFLAALR